MKRNKSEKAFLEELAKTSNISVACEKAGISRQSVYRWMDVDLKFRKKVNKAIQFGIESINDLAELKLISFIKDGNLKAIKYWLDSRKKAYMKPRPKDFWTEIFQQDKVAKGGCFYIDTNGSIEFEETFGQNQKRYKINLEEDDPIFKDMVERYDPVIIKYVDGSDGEGVKDEETKDLDDDEGDPEVI